MWGRTRSFFTVCLMWMMILGIPGVAAEMKTGEAKEASMAELIKRGDEAVKALHHRDAFAAYMAAFEKTRPGSKSEHAIREKIFDVSQKLDPKPAIPEQARRYAVRGMTILKDAKNFRDFRDAARELTKASRHAPWWGDPYYNRGLAYEAAKSYRRSIKSFQLFLAAEPNAKETQAVKTKIYALEVRAERKDRPAAKPKPPPATVAKKEQKNALGTKIGRVSSVNRDWKYVVIRLENGQSVAPKAQVHAQQPGGKVVFLTVEKVTGAKVSATVLGNIDQIVSGMSVYRK